MFRRRALPLSLLLLPLLCGAKPAPRPIGVGGRAEYRVARLLHVDDFAVARLLNLGFDLERENRESVIAYVTVEEMEKLEALGISWVELPDPGLEALARQRSSGGSLAPTAASYHNYTQLTAKLQEVRDAYPGIVRLVSAGTSVQGRELWWLKLTDNPDANEDEPAFKYISTMHGDEPVGTEMLLNLIDYLTQGYGSDSRATRIVNEIELWIMPMMNPDGNTLSQRYNANGVDLNRDFPDQFQDPVDSPTGRELETQRLMNWQYGKTTTLSANFHTGAVVVNYPYDSTASGLSVYSACPDDDIARDVSLDYSENNAPMYNGAFPQGITNGADWYNVWGGMQDWNYLWHGDFQVTIELNDPKWPAASVLDQRWLENKESMLSYLERSLTGVRGVVSDAVTSAPVKATLKIVGRDVPFFADPAVGDFHRILPAGNFQLRADALGYESKTVPFSVASARGAATRVDVQLQPLPTALQVDASRVASDSGNNSWFDAGETGQLAVSLRNTGASATGTHGTLRLLTPYATVDNAADWPTIGSGSAAESLPPHFGLHVAPSTPPGHKLAFAVDWTTPSGPSGTTEAFFVPIGAPATAQRPSADTPRAIPNNGSTQSQIVVADDLEIVDVNARVDITHPFIGDLRVTLIAPDGTSARLHDQGGGSADNINTVYDTATAPVDSLARFVGKSTQGTWTLRVQDLAPANSGSLRSWVLELVTRPFEIPLPEVTLRGITKVGANTEISWWPVGSATGYKVYRSSDPSNRSAFVDVSSEDPDRTDRRFIDSSATPPNRLTCWLVTATGIKGEGRLGHFGQ